MAKRIVFTETGEFRVPRDGEYYTDSFGQMQKKDCHQSMPFERHIYTRTEETIPDPPKPRPVVYVPKATLGPTDVHDTCFNINGVNYYSVEVPTETEMVSNAIELSAVEVAPFMLGAKWLASKLGIKIE